MIGPPKLPPNPLYFLSTRLGPPVSNPLTNLGILLKALRLGSFNLKNPLPCHWFVPFWETTLICAPLLRPSSAEYVLDVTWTSLTLSCVGVMTAPPQV